MAKKDTHKDETAEKPVPKYEPTIHDELMQRDVEQEEPKQ